MFSVFCFIKDETFFHCFQLDTITSSQDTKTNDSSCSIQSLMLTNQPQPPVLFQPSNQFQSIPTPFLSPYPNAMHHHIAMQQTITHQQQPVPVSLSPHYHHHLPLVHSNYIQHQSQAAQIPQPPPHSSSQRSSSNGMISNRRYSNSSNNNNNSSINTNGLSNITTNSNLSSSRRPNYYNSSSSTSSNSSTNSNTGTNWNNNVPSMNTTNGSNNKNTFDSDINMKPVVNANMIASNKAATTSSFGKNTVRQFSNFNDHQSIRKTQIYHGNINNKSQPTVFSNSLADKFAS